MILSQKIFLKRLINISKLKLKNENSFFCFINSILQFDWKFCSSHKIHIFTFLLALELRSNWISNIFIFPVLNLNWTSSRIKIKLQLNLRLKCNKHKRKPLQFCFWGFRGSHCALSCIEWPYFFTRFLIKKLFKIFYS